MHFKDCPKTQQEILMKNYKDPNDAAVRKDFPGGWKDDSIDKFNVSNLNAKEKEASFAGFPHALGIRARYSHRRFL